MARLPKRVYDLGEDPDPRFSLANERTYLAWVRTSLALIATGVGLETLATGLQPELRLAASLVLIVTGAATPLVAWLGWVSVERSLRLNQPLPSPRFAGPVGGAVVIAGILIVIAVLVS
jgi:putative membrane protein